jgi:pimeloyl-ACP methyl ester carboxylesterase
MVGPAPALGLRHEFVEANGLRFHLAACGGGERLALCLHGFPECWYSWRHQLPLLARLGYRVWAPDLRGYGETDRPTHVADYAIETLMDDVAGLIDASEARSTVLIAHDWGAVIAWFFAMRRLRPLERLVVMNAPHPAAAGPAFRTWRQRRRSWYALFFQIPWLPEKLIGARGFRALDSVFRRSGARPDCFPEEVIAVYREAAARPGAIKAMLDYYRALLRGGGLVRQREIGFPPIETPTLMVWGEDDIALVKETTFGTEAFVRDLTVRYLPGVSHWVQQDAPETVNAMLEAWLTERPVPEAAVPEG